MKKVFIRASFALTLTSAAFSGFISAAKALLKMNFAASFLSDVRLANNC